MLLQAKDNNGKVPPPHPPSTTNRHTPRRKVTGNVPWIVQEFVQRFLVIQTTVPYHSRKTAFIFSLLHRSKLQNLNNSGLRRTRWAENMACFGGENVYRMLGKPEGKVYLQNPIVSASIILKWLLEKYN